MPRGKPPPRTLVLFGRIFWTVGGLGFVPLIPGTAGTLAGVAIVYFVTSVPGPDNLLLAGLAGLFTLVGVPLANLAERVHGKDPQTFVWDEVTGYLVTMFALPIDSQPWLCVVGGFFAFRFFDILKPWPIRLIEQKPGGISVMADDIVAGLYASATLHLLLVPPIRDALRRLFE